MNNLAECYLAQVRALGSIFLPLHEDDVWYWQSDTGDDIAAAVGGSYDC